MTTAIIINIIIAALAVLAVVFAWAAGFVSGGKEIKRRVETANRAKLWSDGTLDNYRMQAMPPFIHKDARGVFSLIMDGVTIDLSQVICFDGHAIHTTAGEAITLPPRVAAYLKKLYKAIEKEDAEKRRRHGPGLFKDRGESHPQYPLRDFDLHEWKASHNH